MLDKQTAKVVEIAMNFKARVAKAKKRAVAALKAVGIKDPFTVRVKKVGGEALGLYRHHSQFMQRGPIFWINEDLPKIAKKSGVSERLDDILLDTLLHEYGHVIYEFALEMAKHKYANQTKAFWKDIQAQNTGPGFEEEFAEMIAHTLGDGHIDPVYYEFAERYAELLEAPEIL